LTATLVAHKLDVEAAVGVVGEDVERPHAALGDQVRSEPLRSLTFGRGAGGRGGPVVGAAAWPDSAADGRVRQEILRSVSPEDPEEGVV
jgi:hypothetical protein